MDVVWSTPALVVLPFFRVKGPFDSKAIAFTQILPPATDHLLPFCPTEIKLNVPDKQYAYT
jgi:hypothetical protein